MVTNLIHDFRMSLMKDILPIGMAIAKRIWRRGPKDMIEIFTIAESPIERLREEGNEAARLVRETLDGILPGLGNPPVKTNINRQYGMPINCVQINELETILNQIELDLDLLSKCLKNL
uniref:Uncharacterized protein n=1 Tax=Paulinella chromatophora TaxID=39717 RepID=B1X4J8_PAUCH|nr:hypothetical protein PCC_0428 [Paulinella chromatophora]ACB42867.1 hypothetical protein PCC_0428 [Paulinella chromatophora]